MIHLPRPCAGTGFCMTGTVSSRLALSNRRRASRVISPSPARAAPQTKGTCRGSSIRTTPSPPCAAATPRRCAADRARRPATAGWRCIRRRPLHKSSPTPGMTKRPERRRDEQQRIDHDLPAGLDRTDDIGQHRHADPLVVAAAAERQRPEVRRRPQEDEQKERDRPDRERVPVAAAHPITGGNAPAAPPITMLSGVRRFRTIV